VNATQVNATEDFCMKLLLAGILTMTALLGAAPASAQVESREGIALQNQILELRHELDQLRQPGGRGGSALGEAAPSTSSAAPVSDITAALLDRVSRLEDEVRTLRGQLDETNNALQQQNADLDKQIADLKFRLGISDSIAPAAGAPPAEAGAPPGTAPSPAAGGSPVMLSPPPGNLGATPPPPPPPPPVRRTPEQALQAGNAALARRDYATAEAMAHEVLAVPKSPRGPDAQFLLAQALAGKRDYSAAALAYDAAYKRARTGPHAQDSLLGLAVVLHALGDGRAACATLDKLKAEFPTPRPDLREPIFSIRKRAECH
jgi:TolA-binding protein